jgi:hypothetical protein
VDTGQVPIAQDWIRRLVDAVGLDPDPNVRHAIGLEAGDSGHSLRQA